MRALRLATSTLHRAGVPATQFSLPSLQSTSRLYSTAPPRPDALSSITSSLRARATAGSSSQHTVRKQPPYTNSFVEGVRSPPSATKKSQAPLREPTEAEILDRRWSNLVPVQNNAISLTLTTSRSIEVKGSDIAMAYRRLTKILNENNIRRELKRQERFESGSDMRVRLNSERHRRRYKVAVGKAVSLAMRMKE